MKKFLIAAVSALTIAATALSLSACGSTAKKLKVLNVTLTGEQYGYCVNKSDTTILTTRQATLAWSPPPPPG